MHRLKSTTLLLALALPLAGCAGARLTETIRNPYSGPPIQSIAIDPRGGVMGDQIAVELANSGLNILDSDHTAHLALRQEGKFPINSPEGHEELRVGGVDALLVVRAMIGWDGKPQIVKAQLISTHTSDVITDLSWQNGWGGEFGSVADRTMRKSMSEAARQISELLLTRIG